MIWNLDLDQKTCSTRFKKSFFKRLGKYFIKTFDDMQLSVPTNDRNMQGRKLTYTVQKVIKISAI